MTEKRGGVSLLLILFTAVNSFAAKVDPDVCRSAMMSPGPAFAFSSSNAAHANYNWPADRYQDYLKWVHREFAPGVYVTYEDNFSLPKVLSASALTLDDLVHAKGRVLLAGEGSVSGVGLYSTLKQLRHGHANPGEEVVALDLAYSGRTGSLVEGTVTKMPFHDNSFSLVISHMVAHYLRKGNGQTDFVEETLRVLEPGGEAHLGPFTGDEILKLYKLSLPATLTTEPADHEGYFVLKIKKS